MTYVTDKGNDYDLVKTDVVVAFGKIGVNIEDKYIFGESLVYRGVHYVGIYCDSQKGLFRTMIGQPLIFSDSWRVVNNLGLELARFHSRQDAITYCESLIDVGWSGYPFNNDWYLPELVLANVLLTL